MESGDLGRCVGPRGCHRPDYAERQKYSDHIGCRTPSRLYKAPQYNDTLEVTHRRTSAGAASSGILSEAAAPLASESLTLAFALSKSRACSPSKLQSALPGRPGSDGEALEKIPTLELVNWKKQGSDGSGLLDGELRSLPHRSTRQCQIPSCGPGQGGPRAPRQTRVHQT